MAFDLDQIDRLLTTTRAVRRRLDLTRDVELDVVLECLRLALQAPNGSNQQNWRFVLVQDEARKSAIAEICRRASGGLGEKLLEKARAVGDETSERLYGSAVHLMDHLHEVPMLVVPCYLGRPTHFAEHASMAAASLYGSIFPAIWSFQLALRSRGLGSAITTVHLLREDEVAEVLGIPEDVTQIALLPVAYTRGDEFRPASRLPVEEVSFVDAWGNAPS